MSLGHADSLSADRAARASHAFCQLSTVCIPPSPSVSEVRRATRAWSRPGAVLTGRQPITTCTACPDSKGPHGSEAKEQQ